MTTPPAPLAPRPVDPALVHGAVELEPTPRGLLPHRLPGWARARTDWLAKGGAAPTRARPAQTYSRDARAASRGPKLRAKPPRVWRRRSRKS